MNQPNPSTFPPTHSQAGLFWRLRVAERQLLAGGRGAEGKEGKKGGRMEGRERSWSGADHSVH